MTDTLRNFQALGPLVSRCQARRLAKCREASAPFDDHLWFSDVYVKREGGWTYVFGQASLRLPA